MPRSYGPRLTPRERQDHMSADTNE
jgi:hypothetical protein